MEAFVPGDVTDSRIRPGSNSASAVPSSVRGNAPKSGWPRHAHGHIVDNVSIFPAGLRLEPAFDRQLDAIAVWLDGKPLRSCYKLSGRFGSVPTCRLKTKNYG